MRRIKRLSARQIETLKTPGRFADGAGLELQVSKTGTKSWLFRYMLNGREHRLGLGSTRTFSLAEARERARQARQKIADGIDPLAEKRKVKLEEPARMLTFREAAEAYMSVKLKGFRSDKHRYAWRSTIEMANRTLGHMPVSDIDTAMVLRMLRPIWDETPVTAMRLRGRVESVLGWATVSGYRTGDNPARWRGHLQTMFVSRPEKKHLPALDYRLLPQFMVELRQRDDISSRALEITILSATRTTDTLGARWGEIDFVERLWTISAARTKRTRQLQVPLSDRAIEILKSLPRSARPSADDFVFSPGQTSSRTTWRYSMS